MTGAFVVWGVRPLIPAACGLACLGFAGWALTTAGPEDRLVAGVGALVAAIVAAVLLSMRRRLTAGSQGFTLRGPAGARQVDWTRVTAISAPTRRRRGLASTSVEVELDDDVLIMLGRTELGADPVEVAAELQRRWRPAP